MSIAISYAMWKQHRMIIEERCFKKRRDDWVEETMRLNECDLMAEEDKK